MEEQGASETWPGQSPELRTGKVMGSGAERPPYVSTGLSALHTPQLQEAGTAVMPNRKTRKLRCREVNSLP